MVRYFHDGEVKLDSLIRGYLVYSENQDSTHVHKRQAKIWPISSENGQTTRRH